MTNVQLHVRLFGWIIFALFFVFYWTLLAIMSECLNFTISSGTKKIDRICILGIKLGAVLHALIGQVVVLLTLIGYITFARVRRTIPEADWTYHFFHM